MMRAQGRGLNGPHMVWCRFNTVLGVTAFDLETFLSVVERSHKWQCPTSMKNATVYELQIDTFTQRILAQLKVCAPHGMPGSRAQSHLSRSDSGAVS